MGWLEGMIGGFNDRLQQEREENFKREQMAQNRAQNLFTTLMNSDDPEAQAYGLSGMIESAKPGTKKRGLGGWLGEMETSPVLGQIRQFMNTPQTKQVTEQVRAPSDYGAGGMGDQGPTKPMLTPGAQPELTPAAGQTQIPEPVSGPTAALAAGSQVTGTGATPPPSLEAAPGAGMAAPPPPLMINQTRTVTGPRRIFLGPLAKATAAAQGKEVGDIRGLKAGLAEAGFTPEEQNELVKQHVIRRVAGMGGAGALTNPVRGTMPDGSVVWGAFDRRPGSPTFGKHLSTETGEPLAGFQPMTTTASFTMGHEVESVASELYGKRAAQLINNPAAMAHVNAVVLQRKNALTINQAMQHAHTMQPNASLGDQMDLADRLMKGTAAPVPEAAPAGTAATPPPATAAAPGAPATSSGASGAPTIAPASTPTTGAAATPPPGPGGARPLGVSLTPAQAAATKETGKPIPPALTLALGKAQSTNDLIDQALEALKPFKDDNTLQGSINLARSYREGTFNPITSAAVQLADLAGIQQKNQQALVGGSRAKQPYVERSQHVPKVPSYRQVQATGWIGADATQSVSGWLKNDEGTFDTPQAMYQKLLKAKEANGHFINDVIDLQKEGTAAAAVGGSGAAGTPPPAPTSPGGTQMRQVNGKWVLSGPGVPQ